MSAVSTAVQEALEALFFGSVWYFGILIFIILALSIMKIYKYAGALIIPMIIALEVAYYNQLSETPEFAWAMLALLILAIIMAVYAIFGKAKD